MKYEYNVRAIDSPRLDDDRALLDTAGQNGWELVSVVIIPQMRDGQTLSCRVLYFRRPLP